MNRLLEVEVYFKKSIRQFLVYYPKEKMFSGAISLEYLISIHSIYPINDTKINIIEKSWMYVGNILYKTKEEWYNNYPELFV